MNPVDITSLQSLLQQKQILENTPTFPTSTNVALQLLLQQATLGINQQTNYPFYRSTIAPANGSTLTQFLLCKQLLNQDMTRLYQQLIMKEPLYSGFLNLENLQISNVALNNTGDEARRSLSDMKSSIKVPVHGNSAEVSTTISSSSPATASIRNLESEGDKKPEEPAQGSAPVKKAYKRNKKPIEESYLEQFGNDEDEFEEDDSYEEDFKPTKHCYYVAKKTITTKRELPKRKRESKEDSNSKKEVNEIEALQGLLTDLEPVLGYKEIDQTKVLGILAKSQMNPKIVMVKIKSNLNYYKKTLKNSQD